MIATFPNLLTFPRGGAKRELDRVGLKERIARMGQLNPLGGAASLEAMAAGVVQAAFSPADLSPVWWGHAPAQSFANNDPVGTLTATAGPNAAQSTSGARPTFKTAIQNGLAVIRSDTDDGMATTAVSVGSFTFCFAGACSAGGIVAEQSANCNSNDGFYLFRVDSARYATQINRGGTVNYKEWGVTTANFNIVILRYGGAGATHQLWLNGTELSPSTTIGGTPGTGTANDTLNLLARGNAGSQFTSADFGTGILIPSAVSDANVTNLFTYLNGIWSAY